MKNTLFPPARGPLLRLLMMSGVLACAGVSQAAPAILSSIPANMASGVSPATSIQFVFSEAMSPDATSVMVMDANTLQSVDTSAAWSSGNTVLTCTPTTMLPVSHMIIWSVDGLSAAGVALGGTAAGMFTTGAAATGCDTNALMLSFTVSKGWGYSQDSTAAPALNTNFPYSFLACMSLPCPRDATNVNLKLPGGSVCGMNLAYSGHLTFLDANYTDPSALDAAYPSGDYTFTIRAVSSNQQVTVNFPSSVTQPPAPHLNNYLAAQAIDPARPFALSWDPMTGGTAADYIYVEIYGGLFKTPALGEAGALRGTATSATIPAGSLQPNQQYSGGLTFYRCELQTNGTAFLSLAYRASITEFTLQTAGGGPSLVLTNAAWTTGGAFTFEVTCARAQALVAEYTADLASGPWVTLCSTNSPAERVRFTDPDAGAKKQLFYRVRTGP